MNRYNKKVYFPEEDREELKRFNDRINRQNFSFSVHCLDNIKYRAIDIEKVVKFVKDIEVFNMPDIFEYYKDNEIEKCCYRIEYDNMNDIILVLSKYKKIVTIYFNQKEDKHFTLNKKAYSTK